MVVCFQSPQVKRNLLLRYFWKHYMFQSFGLNNLHYKTEGRITKPGRVVRTSMQTFCTHSRYKTRVTYFALNLLLISLPKLIHYVPPSPSLIGWICFGISHCPPHHPDGIILSGVCSIQSMLFAWLLLDMMNIFAELQIIVTLLR